MPQNKSILSELRNYLLINLGLNFTKRQESILHNKIELASKSFNFKSTDSFINWILNKSLDNTQIEKLSTFLTIGETYFFRENKAYDYLETKYLPQLLNLGYKKSTNKTLKIWCAGCSTGEEPYSVAIMLRRVIPNIENWNISILATDINPNYIEKAKKGIYSKWSFRGKSKLFANKYFEKTRDNKYQISKEIREMVTFKSLNLIKEKFPLVGNQNSEMDIILCRNVMIYFSNEGVNAVVDKFSNSLKKGGLFITGSVEVPNVKNSNLKPFVHNGITLFIKGSNLHLNTTQNLSQKEMYVKYSNSSLNEGVASKSTMNSEVTSNLSKKSIHPIAVKSFKRGPLKISEDVEINYQKALSCYNSGLVDEAESILEALPLKNNENMLLLLAKIKADKGRLDVSEEMYLKVIETNKINFEAHFLLSSVLSEQGKLKEARKSLRNSLFLNPDFALGHFLLGNIALQSGEEVEYKKHFRSALKTLETVSPEQVLDKSNGLTAARLTSIIKTIG